jgi:hypothetical protein
MSKVKLILLLVAAAIVTNGIQFAVQHKISTNKASAFTAEVSRLQASIDAVGPIVECWTPTAVTRAGQTITAENLTVQSIPESFINETFVLDQNKLIGRLFKISLAPGTPITSDCIMEEALADSTRDVDITGTRWPVGLVAGDYVDLRITYPYGEDYVVLSHVRVEEITLNAFKVYLDEVSYQRYQGALVDFYLSRELGTDLYFTKYVEPGLQDPATIYYEVPQTVLSIMRFDPNIPTTAQIQINAEIRDLIDSAIQASQESDEDSGRLASGRAELNGEVKSAYQQKLVEEEAAEIDKQNEEALVEDEAVFNDTEEAVAE